MKKTKIPYYEIFSLIIGEVLVAAIMSLIYVLIDKFDYKVITGASLGSVITVLNFLFLSITTTAAINNFLMLKGEKEMTEEETQAFVAEHQMKIQSKITLSYIIRTVTMLLALILAFVIKHFDVIATVIPILLYKPITMLAALIKRKVIKE